MFELEECTLCPLGQNGSNLVLGDDQRAMDHNPVILFLGEAPGRDEDRIGVPFVGRAGKLLRKCIEQAGIESFYISNVCYCRPPDNRTPFWNEMNICGHYTLLEIACVNPDLIVTLGKVATEFLGSFIDSDMQYSEYRNQVWPFNHPVVDEQYQLLPIFHPAYILRRQDKKNDYLKQFKRMVKLINS